MWIHLAAFFPALLYANMGEWFFHRYVLHGLGKRRESFWSYHWYGHHQACSNGSMRDAGYDSFPRRWNVQAKELFVLGLILILHFPLFFIIPGFAAGFYFSIAFYYFRHRRAHVDDEWALSHLSWHCDHHASHDPQSANWCITWPWFDYVMGTRVKGGVK